MADGTIGGRHPTSKEKLALQYHPRTTMILTGMRGCGKAALGRIAAASLSRRFIDLDEAVESAIGTTAAEFIASHGEEALRARELAALRELLARYPRDAIVACGGGRIVEDEACREYLQAVRRMHPVIVVLRERAALRRINEAERGHDDGADARGSADGSGGLSPGQAQEHSSPGEDSVGRREHLLMDSASHIFIVLSEERLDFCRRRSTQERDRGEAGPGPSLHPLSLKPIERSFLRLIRFVLGDDGSLKAVDKPGVANEQQPSASPAREPAVSKALSRTSISHLLIQADETSDGPGSRAAKGAVKASDVDDVEMKAEVPTAADVGPSKINPPVPSRQNCKGRPPPPLFESLPGAADATSRASLLTRRTTSLSVTCSDLRRARSEDFELMVEGIDALELRLDLMDCLRPASAKVRKPRSAEGPASDEQPPIVDLHEVALQVERLRALAGDLPLLFTVRSDREGGDFFDDRDIVSRGRASRYSQALYLRLLELALQMGVEMLDVELGWDASVIRTILEKRGRTRIIATYRDLQGYLRWDSILAQQLYDRARSFEGIDVVEIIGTARPTAPEQNFHLLSFQARILSAAASDPSHSLPPLISLNLGEAGQSTRPFNACLSPVSHDLQARKASPGQMSILQLIRCQADVGLVVERKLSLLLDDEEARSWAQSATYRTLEAGYLRLGLPYTFVGMDGETMRCMRQGVLPGARGDDASTAQENGRDGADARIGMRVPVDMDPEQRRGFMIGSKQAYWQRRVFELFRSLPHVDTRLHPARPALETKIGNDTAPERHDGTAAVASVEQADRASAAPLLGPPLTMDAWALRAVDVAATADVSQRLLGTPAGHMIPHGFCSLPGPMVGDHSLPRALQRLVSDHLSPANAPAGPSSSALVVMLEEEENDEHPGNMEGVCEDDGDQRNDGADASLAELKLEIEARAALLALGRLRFGRCYVLRVAAHARDLGAPGGGSEAGEGAWWDEVAELVKAEAASTARATAAVAESTTACMQPVTRADPDRFDVVSVASVEALGQELKAQRRTTRAATSEASGAEVGASNGQDSSGDEGDDAHPGSARPRPPSASIAETESSDQLPCHPRVVVVLGGSEAFQMQALRHVVQSEAVSEAPTSAEAREKDGFALPAWLWDTPHGGTLVRVRGRERPPSSPSASTSTAVAAATTLLDAHVERHGWVHVDPLRVEFERLAGGAFAPFTRRRPPRPNMADAFVAAIRSEDDGGVARGASEGERWPQPGAAGG